MSLRLPLGARAGHLHLVGAQVAHTQVHCTHTNTQPVSLLFLHSSRPRPPVHRLTGAAPPTQSLAGSVAVSCHDLDIVVGAAQQVHHHHTAHIFPYECLQGLTLACRAERGQWVAAESLEIIMCVPLCACVGALPVRGWYTTLYPTGVVSGWFQLIRKRLYHSSDTCMFLGGERGTEGGIRRESIAIHIYQHKYSPILAFRFPNSQSVLTILFIPSSDMCA